MDDSARDGLSVLAGNDRIHGFLIQLLSRSEQLLLAGTLVVIMAIFFYQPVVVKGVSMEPKLGNQERVFVNKFIYNFKQICRGDIVVFWYPRDPRKPFIKRVVGIPGDQVVIERGQVYVNGELLEELNVPGGYRGHCSFPAVRVFPSTYYVLGDYRSASNDSRSWGLVPRKNIYGRAVFRYWPLEKAGFLD